MKLYYCAGTCSLASRIVINEISLAVDYESVNLRTKKTETGADYLIINPKGAVPAIITDQDEILTETAVILQYLADTYKASQLLPPVGDFKRYRVLEYLNYISSEIHKSFSPFFSDKFDTDTKQRIFIPLLKSKFNTMEKALAQKSFLMGDTFTLADAYLFVMLTWLHFVKIDVSEWENLSRYYHALQQRPSIQQSLNEEKKSS